MFLFFVCDEYEPGGGYRDMIGKTDGISWQHFMDLVKTTSFKKFDRHEIQALNLEKLDTLEVHVGVLDAKREEDGTWKVTGFLDYDKTPDSGFLAGIPFQPTIKREVLPRPKPVPADFLFYKLSASALVREFSGGKVVEHHLFEFMVMRLKDKPLPTVTGQLDEIVEALALRTFLQQHGEQLNVKYGHMTWQAQIPRYRCKLWEDYEPDELTLNSLPQNQDEAFVLRNLTYEELDVKPPQ